MLGQEHPTPSHQGGSPSSSRALTPKIAASHLQDLEGEPGGDQDSFGRLVHAVVCPANTLQQPGDPFGRADLDNLINPAPIDAQVQRGGCHHRAQAAGGHGGFDFAALFDFQRAMVEGDRKGAVVQLPQRLEHEFGLGAGVDEDDGHARVFDVTHDLRGGFEAHVAVDQDRRPSGKIIRSSGGTPSATSMRLVAPV